MTKELIARGNILAVTNQLIQARREISWGEASESRTDPITGRAENHERRLYHPTGSESTSRASRRVRRPLWVPTSASNTNGTPRPQPTSHIRSLGQKWHTNQGNIVFEYPLYSLLTLTPIIWRVAPWVIYIYIYIDLTVVTVMSMFSDVEDQDDSAVV